MSVYAGPEITTNGLVLHLDAANAKSYPGSGTTWTDLSGNGNNGTLTNGPTFSSGNGGSIAFDGINDTTTIANASNLNFGTGDFTISFFIYVSSSGLVANKEYGVINKNTSYQGAAGWCVEVSSYNHSSPFNTLDLLFFNSGQSSFENTLIYYTSFPTNAWCHIAATRVSTTGKLYVNGNLVNQLTHNDWALNVNNSANTVIGKNDWGQYFSGNMSNLSIYNKALTAAEISQNFNALRGRFGI